MEAPAGKRFGRYELVRRLAHGGMAEIYLARQHGLQGIERRVAIKRILPHLADSDDFLRMFLEEARLVSSLSHPNVVHIYELGKVDEDYFITMEYIDGVHAGELIERGGQPPVPAALVARIGADACAALNYVHHACDAEGRPLRLVHRDISPPNLMISYDGVVKLMDFGIAKAAGQVDLTRPGVVKGKFAYMSPEQTMGETLDGRSDVFSLCLILWELLAGRVALPRTDPVEAMMMIRDGQLPSIRSVRADVPAALATVLERGLQVDREHRATAAELGHELESFIKTSPELGTSMQLSTWVRRELPPRPITGGEPEDAKSGEAPDASAAAAGPSEPVLPAPVPEDDEDEQTVISTGPPMGMMVPEPAPVPDREQKARLPGLPPAAELARPTLAEPARPTTATRPGPSTGQARGGRRPIVLAALGGAGLFWLVLLGVALWPAGPASNRAQGAGRQEADQKADAPGAPVRADPSADETAAGRVGPVLPGRLIVVTAPPGAGVSLDGGPTQSAPARFVELAPGPHTVTIRLDGYRTEERTVQITGGQVQDLVVSLRPGDD